jgi:hypothetical protein
VPRTLPPGLYESLITCDLAKAVDELRRTGHETAEEPLDPGDGHVAFARHVVIALARVLESFPESERGEKQLALVTEILALLAERSPRPLDGGRRIAYGISSSSQSLANGSSRTPSTSTSFVPR